MLSWSKKRQIIYLALVVGFFIFVTTVFLFFLLYETPTCFDGKQNQEEIGIDCGGPCVRLCVFQVEELSVLWSDAFLAKDGVYDMVVFIENKNINAGIRNLGYTIKAYNSSGDVLAERSGATYINAMDRFALIEHSTAISEKPTRIDVEFDVPKWERTLSQNRHLKIKNKRLFHEKTPPRITAIVENNSLDTKRNIEAVALISNKKGEVVAISSTHMSTLAGDSEGDLFFALASPIKKNPENNICITSVDVVLIIDRSGSMNDDGLNPPQPLTDAKESAIQFISNIRKDDQVGLVSFATVASYPIDHKLTLNHKSVKESIDAVEIFTNEIQHTNIGDSIKKATKELTSTRNRGKAIDAIVLLTDGIATRPRNPQNINDVSYAENYAVEHALVARENNIIIYVIGLGGGVDEEFLRDEIASSKDKYYKALTVGELSEVYNEIAQIICAEEIFTTEINVRANNFSTTR